LTLSTGISLALASANFASSALHLKTAAQCSLNEPLNDPHCAGCIGRPCGDVLKSPCTLHPSLSTVILSGFGVQGMKSLAFLCVFLCTPKPDTFQETRHRRQRVTLHKSFIFEIIGDISGYFAIPDTITVAVKEKFQIGSA